MGENAMNALKNMLLIAVFCLVSMYVFGSLNNNHSACSEIGWNTPHASITVLGTFEEGRPYRNAVPEADYEQIKKAAFNVQTSFRREGDAFISYSRNGDYKIEKIASAGADGRDHVITTLFGRDGRSIWEGETGFHVIVSNNGRNLVSSSLDYVGLTFYDTGSSEPLLTYPGEWRTMSFSYDGRSVIATTRQHLHLFTADGVLLWKMKFRRHGGLGAVISRDGSYILVNDRVAPPNGEKQPDSGTGEPDREQKRKPGQKEFRGLKAPPVHVEPKTECSATLLRNDGSVIREISLPFAHPHYMCFSPDAGGYAAIAGGEKIAFIDSDSGEIIWIYTVGEPGYWIGPIAVSAGGGYVVIGAADGRSDSSADMRYELLDMGGERIGRIATEYTGNGITFSEDSRYLVVWNNGLKILKIMEVTY
jgi:hypothetical protein